MNIGVRKITVSDFLDFCVNARELDLKEVELGYKPFPLTLLSDYSKAIAIVDLDTNEVYAIGGVSDSKLTWLLCTTRVEKNKIAFLRFCKEYIYEWFYEYGTLSNYVWAKNDLHVKWLKWLGAEFKGTVYVDNEPFIYFEIRERGV